MGVDGSSIATAAQGCAPVAAGTCVARALGDEMTGEPAMLPSGCWEDDIDVMPVIILDELTGVEPVDSPDVEPILACSLTMG